MVWWMRFVHESMALLVFNRGSCIVDVVRSALVFGSLLCIVYVSMFISIPQPPVSFVIKECGCRRCGSDRLDAAVMVGPRGLCVVLDGEEGCADECEDMQALRSRYHTRSLLKPGRARNFRAGRKTMRLEGFARNTSLA
jgi:hypothetical protein